MQEIAPDVHIQGYMQIFSFIRYFTIPALKHFVESHYFTSGEG